MASDENSLGNSSGQSRDVIAQDMTLGRGPFQRDPGWAAAVSVGKSMAESSKKLHPQVLLLLNKGSKMDISKQNCSSLEDSAALEADRVPNKGITTVKTEAKDKQSCSSDGDLATSEEEKDTSSSGVCMKRKAKTLDTLSNRKKTSAANKDLQKKWHCTLCGLSATSEKGLNDHLQGKKHKNKEASAKFNDPTKKISSERNSNRLHCSLCDKYIPSEKRLKVHLEGRKHKAKEAMLGKSGHIAVQSKAMNMDFAESKEILNVAFEVPCQKNDDMGCPSNEEVSRKGIEGAENPNDECDHTEPILDLGKQEEIKKENTQEVRLKKSWHCQMCNLTCNDETEMAAHRRGSEHKSLLSKKRGGVIVVSRIPEEEALQKGGEQLNKSFQCLLKLSAKSTSLENRPETMNTECKEVLALSSLQ